MRPAIELAVKLAGFWFVLSLAMISPGNFSRTEAGGFVITTTTDSGAGSFRQALTEAGNSAGADTITFDSGVFPPGTPATIQATANYIVEAPAASDPLTIDATGAGVIFDFTGITEGEAAFHWRADGPMTGITLKNFTIQNFAPDDHHAGHGVEFGFAPTTVTDVLIENMTIINNQQNALFLNADEEITNSFVRNNKLSENGHSGVQLSAGRLVNVHIHGNDIHENTSGGIAINVFDPSAAVLVFENSIVSNGGDAIFVAAPEVENTIHAPISQNITANNAGLGINLLGFGNEFEGVTENDIGDTDLGPNGLLNFPVLHGAGPTGITGTACANCTIEIFLSDSDPSGHGEGATFLATGMADGAGDFNIEACAPQGASVTATATDIGNTSEFALNYTLPTASCDTRLQGDLDCDGDVGARDALIAMIHDAGAAQTTREPGCPELGSALAQPASTSTGPDVFGDVNCDTDVGVGDAITILQHIAELPLVPEPPSTCVPIGDPLPQ